MPSDLPTSAGFSSPSAGRRAPSPAQRAAAGLAGRDGSVSVALLDGVPTGFCAVELYAWNALAQIWWLAVDPASQRSRRAPPLVAQARAQGARGSYLDTPVDNLRGRAFYEAVGFVAVYLISRYDSDRTTA